ncbi:MAG TPA: ParB/RepB/Spo0J family partition protein [Candidatus Megaira endosymbiont of Nemacystus decipiens]|nr:ParB/RepB/Spo0J family partition protein [Candidatus Megaera endosymbiont of Nemacystus decipiens]
MKIDSAKIKTPIFKKKDKTNSQRVSAYTESYKGEYYNLEINNLIPFKNQARKVFDEKSLEELARTVKLYGIRQPLTVLPSETNEGFYEIISGERRLRAAQIAGLKKVPCVILQDQSVANEIALVENVQRKNLHPIKLMKGFQTLLEKAVCKNQQEIAEKIGVARTTVVETLALASLPSSSQDLLLKNNIKSRAVLRKLLKAPQQEHEAIIKSTRAEKNLLQKKASVFKKNKKKVLSVYFEFGSLVFDEENISITTEQRDELKKQLKNFIEKL